MAEKNTGHFSEKTKLTIPAYSVLLIMLSLCYAFLDAYTPQLTALGFNWVTVKSVLPDVVLKFLLTIRFGVGLIVNFQQLTKLGAKTFAIGVVIALLAGVLALILAIAVGPFVPPPLWLVLWF